MRISGFSSLLSAIAVFLYPPTNVLKVLRSLGKGRKTQKSSPTRKEKVKKEGGQNTGTAFLALLLGVVLYFPRLRGSVAILAMPKAATAITTALKKDGVHKIFIVTSLEAGRVRPEDPWNVLIEGRGTRNGYEASKGSKGISGL